MMDIKTKKGQITLEQEQFMLSRFEDAWKCKAIQTPKDKGAAADGVFSRDKEMKGVFESKCRNLSLAELEDFDTWMISHKKLKECKTLSNYLQVPFYGLLYLLKDNLIMYWKITDDNGEYLFDIQTEIRQTQNTCNGGEKLDDVALIPVSEGKYLQNK